MSKSSKKSDPKKLAPVLDRQMQLGSEYQKVLDAVCLKMAAAGGGRSSLTIKHYRDWFRRFLWSVESRGVPVSGIGEHDLDLFVVRYMGKKHRTKQALAKAMNACFPLMVRCGFIEKAPPRLENLGAAPAIDPYIPSEEQIGRLIKALEELRADPAQRMNHAMVVGLLYTGLRASELIHITRSDLREDGGRIVEVHVVRKARKEGFLPVHRYLDEVWREWLRFRDEIRNRRELRGELHKSVRWANSEFLFPGTQGGHTTYANLHRVVKEFGRKAKVEPFHPHLFRHYFATKLHETGATVPEVMELMGHRDIRSQLPYIRASKERLRKSMERFGDHVVDQQPRDDGE